MQRPKLLIAVVVILLNSSLCNSSGHPLLLPSYKPISIKDILQHAAKTFSTSMSISRSNPHGIQLAESPLGMSISPVPAPLPSYPAYGARPISGPLRKRRGHHHHHHYHAKAGLVAPSPSRQGCEQVCVDPLTAAPYGSPCGCVFPMKVKILLDVATISIFPLMHELEVEIAAGTYLELSQVALMGVSVDSQNQQRTVVDINLLPLGDKFDNTTAILTYERFLHKKVPLNASIFGAYEVLDVNYPGIPSPSPYHNSTGTGPITNPGNMPITVNFGNKNSGMSVKTIAIIALSAFVLLLVLVGAFSVLIKWRRFGRPSNAVGPTFASSINKRSGNRAMISSTSTSSRSTSLMPSMATCVLSVEKFGLAELEKATNRFSSKKILGEGGFGRVYHGAMEDGTEVAVKLLIRANQNRDREFIAEVEMLSRLHHRNLVKLIGICIEGRTRCLVYELVSNGSVESHLHGPDKEDRPLDWDARLKIALGAARGLAYLHEDSTPRVIHRDFKASNVLLEDNFTPKVSDFGLAREATEGSQHISTRVMGTFGYVAPEYAMTGHLLVKSDVYSYGVVLLELLTGRKPVDMSQPSGQENLVTWARPLLATREGLERLIDPSLSGTYDFDHMAKVASIASMCVHVEVTNRPFMGEVVQALKLIYNDTDDTGTDFCSQKESSAHESDFRADLDSNWWNATPRLTYGQASSFMTMDSSSGTLDELENRQFSSPPSFAADSVSLALRQGNRSGPLRIVRNKLQLSRLRGSRSEHGGLFSQQLRRSDAYWV